jgi:hypothetical protein
VQVDAVDASLQVEITYVLRRTGELQVQRFESGA